MADMKSGNFMILNILNALKESGDLKKLDITVAYLGDEESLGMDPDGRPESTRKKLIEIGSRTDVALAFEEGAKGIGYVTAARRGYSRWSLAMTAKGGHSSKIFSNEAGAGAIFPLSAVLNRFYNELRGEQYLTFNVGNIIGGSKITIENDGTPVAGTGKENIIPNQARAMGDL